MRILFAVRGLFPDFIGGAHRHSYQLIKHLAQMDDLYIDVIHPTPNIHFGEFDNVQEFHVPYGVNVYTYSRNVRDFLVNDCRVYDVGYSDGFALWLYLKHKRFQCIFNHHGYHFSQPQFFLHQLGYIPFKAITAKIADWVRELVAYYNVKHADFVISESPIISEILTHRYQCLSEKIIHSSVAVELPRAWGYSSANKIPNSFLCVGNLEYRKGLTYLVKAFETIDTDCSLYIIGDGHLKSTLSRIINKDRIFLLGKVDEEELHTWYARVEAFVFSGLAESGPIVVLEAMTHGLPVIATDVGAVQKMVDGNGWIVPPGDAEAFRAAIEEFLLLDDETKHRMGKRSRTVVEDRFTWDKVAAQYYEVFHSIATI
ncbi:MAG: glycosyltransferase family 4 protein [Planctomycetes bacterium]|nr:glycosyltransferase family 4 protein [Planctomycetota bacterium]